MNRIWKYLLFYRGSKFRTDLYGHKHALNLCTYTYIQTNTIRKDFQGFSVFYFLRITRTLSELAEVSCMIFIVHVGRKCFTATDASTRTESEYLEQVINYNGKFHSLFVCIF